MILSQIITTFILIVIGIVIIKLLLKVGSRLLQLALYVLTGWILLSIANVLPGVNVPINLITILISGFGGVFGTIFLVIMSFIF